MEKQHTTLTTIQSIDEIDPFHKLLLIDMSYSRIDTYSYCPAKYFYSYIYKAERVFAPHATLGNIVHKVLEDHAGEPTSHADLLLEFEKTREEYDPDHLIWDELIRAGENIIEHYSLNYSKKDIKANILGKEMQFEFVLGNAFVRGFIDRVDQVSARKLRCIDWKTGRVVVSKNTVANNLQLATYALALFHQFPEVNQIDAQLHYLKFEKIYSHLFTRKDIPRLTETLRVRIAEVINDHYYKPTPNKFSCNYCDHAISGVCKVGVQRRYKKGQGS